MIPNRVAVKIEPLPVAGALDMDTVANRSLLIGPGGGFIAATGEEMQALTARYSELSPDLLARTKRALEW